MKINTSLKESTTAGAGKTGRMINNPYHGHVQRSLTNTELHQFIFSHTKKLYIILNINIKF
jgi:hypothetical protein